MSPSPGNPSMMITSAWSLGVTGKGVNVVHTDDGIDYTHPDLRKAFKRKLSKDMVNKSVSSFRH